MRALSEATGLQDFLAQEELAGLDFLQTLLALGPSEQAAVVVEVTIATLTLAALEATAVEEEVAVEYRAPL